MISVYVHNYTQSAAHDARRDGEEERVDITSRVIGASWSVSLISPYEVASISTSIRIDELDVLGIGTPRARESIAALHASGWLDIYDDGVRVFYGPIQRLTTGLRVDENGARRSRDVQIVATSWLSIVAQPFKLTSRDDLVTPGGLYSYAQWSEIFESVFSEGAAVDVAEGFVLAWVDLVDHTTPEGDALGSFPTLVSAGVAEDEGVEGRSFSVVRGRNISQVPVAMSGSLWSAITGAFQPAPQLIELFPIRDKGRPFLVYRMKPLAPSNADYFERDDRLNNETDDTGVDAVTTIMQELTRVVSYSLDFGGERNNYIEVTSPYLGVSPLAGLNSSPALVRGDIERYGLSPLEIAYPLLRTTRGELREELEQLTTYAAALYSESHAYANATLETMYQDVRVGEWARWSSYIEGEGATLTGYVTRVEQQVRADAETGVVTRRTNLQLERVSQDLRPSRMAPTLEPIRVTVTPEGDA